MSQFLNFFYTKQFTTTNDLPNGYPINLRKQKNYKFTSLLLFTDFVAYILKPYNQKPRIRRKKP
ncbi:hypothetical protein ACS0TY_007056 [Phlomoides rotata]